jgi:hypothetical protein
LGGGGCKVNVSILINGLAGATMANAQLPNGQLGDRPYQLLRLNEFSHVLLKAM